MAYHRQSAFLVELIDQQHGSWQGTVTWIATGQKVAFRSLLEFLRLVDSAPTLQDDPVD